MSSNTTFEGRNGFQRILAGEPDGIRLGEKLLSALGGFFGIALVAWGSPIFLGDTAMLLIASMGSSAVLLFAAPHAAMSQPRAVFFGHLVSGLSAFGVVYWMPTSAWAAPLAVGLSIGMMYFLRCLHAPGGASALGMILICQSVTADPFVVFVLIMVNILLLLVSALLFNLPWPWRRYPNFLQKGIEIAKPDPLCVLPTAQDFERALQHMDTFTDIELEDLLVLMRHAQEYARQR